MSEAVVDLGALLLGFTLTLFVFSYAVKDNPLFRLAIHLLVGVSAGYVVVIVSDRVLIPILADIISDPTGSANLSWLVPLILSVLLLLKSFPRISWFGNSAMAVLIAVGAAVSLVGALVGTMWPQLTTRYENDVVGILAALLTISVLLYFQFTWGRSDDGQAKFPSWFQAIRSFGQVIITLTLAALFAGALSTSMALFSARVGYFVDTLNQVITTLTS